jgi:hypothetical protein
VDYAVNAVKKRPSLDSISLDPSDGGGWCQCAPCKAIGNVSDRALTLANASAEAINALGLGKKYVGMYAYNEHSPPPTIQVHPNVIISATTAFLRGGFTFDQIMEGWQKKGATMGVYDYFSVIVWDWNRPKASRSANPYSHAKRIRAFYDKGARFLDAESGDAWGPYGLGYYVASRVMWDVDQADKVDAIIDDFLTTSFGDAEKPMREFYTLITSDPKLRSPDDMLARMYRHLDRARKSTRDPAVHRRIDDLILYTRYFELHSTFASATGGAKKKHKQAVLSYAFRIRKTMMIHSYGIWARLSNQRNANNKANPLRQNETPHTPEEIQAILTKGIATYKPVELNFDTIAFSDELVPATPLKLPSVPRGKYPPASQDIHNYYVWVDKGTPSIDLKVRVKHRWNNKPHSISLFSPKDTFVKPIVVNTECKPDNITRDIILKTPFDGLHRILSRDGGDFTYFTFPEDMPVTLPSAMDTSGIKNHFRGSWTLYVYVPKGSKSVAGWAGRIANWAPRISGTLVDPDGNTVHDFRKQKDGWFNVPVKKGHDGKLWTFKNSQGVRKMVNVPPYFSISAETVLLPKEVVEKDSE